MTRPLPPVAALFPALLLACAQTPGGSEAVSHDAEASGVQRAEALFARHCAVCHGPHGRGDGPAYASLFPRARDFSSGRFRLASTANGVPTDADLLGTLRRGMPGSAMPAFGWMPEEDLEALVRHVRELAHEGLAARIVTSEERPGWDEARALAAERMEPGEPLPVLPEREATREELARGSALYAQHCAACHGADGNGSSRPVFDEDGGANWARPFPQGYLKGGASLTELGWRIRTGIPGTSMPGLALSDEDLFALAAHVRELIPPGAEDRFVHRRGTIVAARSNGALPESPDDPAWSSAPSVEVTLAPLAWTERAVFSARVAALHDGERIALRVRWDDATDDLRVFSEATASDAVALQFSEDPSPALFGMGRRGRPNHLWHWRAIPRAEGAGMPELLQSVPHALGEPFRGDARTDVPLYRRALGAPQPSELAEPLVADGVGPPGADADSAPLTVRPHRVDGGWEVVFSRALSTSADQEIEFRPGSTVQLAVAVWNASAGDQADRKAISIWQALEIAP